MKLHKRSIVGISPLLMNNPATMKPTTRGETLGTNIPTPEAEAKAKVYRLESGGLCIPASWITGAMQMASKGRKIGKFTARAIVSGAVFTTREFYPLIDPETSAPITEYVVDARRVVVKGNGVIRGRPKILRWAVDVELEYDEELIKPAVIDELLSIAGRVAGFGDYAPHDNGPFGRFKLLDWTPSPAAAPEPEKKKGKKAA